MKKSDVSACQRQLNTLAKRLESIAETGAEAAKPVELDQTKVGRVSRMDAIRSQAMSLETERRRLAELARIAAAMKRIENGEYGDCLRCGESIALERLVIDPAATLCITCASQAEASDRPR